MTTLKEFLEKEENKNVRSSILDACRSPLVKALMYNDALDKKYSVVDELLKKALNG